MKRIVEQEYIEVITNRERNQIAGRYCTVNRGEGWVVIGTVGSLWPHDLNKRQKHFIANLYLSTGTLGNFSFEVLEKYPDSKLPVNNFNGFLKITKL